MIQMTEALHVIFLDLTQFFIFLLKPRYYVYIYVVIIGSFFVKEKKLKYENMEFDYYVGVTLLYLFYCFLLLVFRLSQNK
jgi:hypothetical protein